MKKGFDKEVQLRSEVALQEYCAALYLWGSLDGGELLSHQMNRLSEYAHTKGWEIVDAYIDYESMNGRARPDLDRLVGDARQGRFDVILTASLERILWGTDFALALRVELLLAEIHLVTLDSMVDTLAGDTALIDFYDWIYSLADVRGK